LKSLIPVLSCTGLLSATAIATTPTSAPPALLPPVGQTVSYRYSDALTSPQGVKVASATLTLTSVTAKDIHVTIAVDGTGSRSLDLQIDPAGALQLVCAPAPLDSLSTGRDQSEQTATVQLILFRLALAARIGAVTSFPVQLSVPGEAGGPVNPILSVTSMQADTFTAEANATTSAKAPEQAHNQVPLLLGGTGLVAAAVSGTTGRIIAVGAGATALAVQWVANRRAHSGPVPVDVKLHVTGELAQGHLRRISGDQENTVGAGRRARTFSDKWSLVAG
jgi:hypothetical protein